MAWDAGQHSLVSTLCVLSLSAQLLISVKSSHVDVEVPYHCKCQVINIATKKLTFLDGCVHVFAIQLLNEMYTESLASPDECEKAAKSLWQLRVPSFIQPAHNKTVLIYPIKESYW